MKTKELDPEKLRKREETLKAGKVHGTAEPLTRRNRHSSIVGDAASQLRATLPDENLLRLVWLQATGSDHDLQWRLFERSLYGLENITSFFDDKPMYSCFHFHESHFFRDRHVIDGAIICFANVKSGEVQAKLCLNVYSERCDELKFSKLGRQFENGVCDPRELDKAGEAYWADCEVERSDKAAVLAYLSTKYDRPNLTDFQLGVLSGEVRM